MGMMGNHPPAATPQTRRNPSKRRGFVGADDEIRTHDPHLGKSKMVTMSTRTYIQMPCTTACFIYPYDTFEHRTRLFRVARKWHGETQHRRPRSVRLEAPENPRPASTSAVGSRPRQRSPGKRSIARPSPHRRLRGVTLHETHPFSTVTPEASQTTSASPRWQLRATSKACRGGSIDEPRQRLTRRRAVGAALDGDGCGRRLDEGVDRNGLPRGPFGLHQARCRVSVVGAVLNVEVGEWVEVGWAFRMSVTS